MAQKQPEKDTLWSWIVLAAVTVILFLETGLMKSLSVLLPDLREQLSSRTWIIGSCISIVYGWGSVIGMTSGSLLQTFGARVTLAVSGCLTCIGLIVCACATNVYSLLFGMLLIGFMYIQENIAIGMLSHYFDKYFAVSVSTFLLGANISVMVMPPLTQLFIETYGWRGTVLLLSAINFQSVLCGVIINKKFKENTDTNEQKASKQEKAPLLPDAERHSDEKLPESRCGFLKTILEDMGGSLLTNTHILVRVLVPGFVWGYTFSGWLIYTVSYAVSNGATMREAALVSTCGGIGLALTRLVLPLINRIIHYKYLIYASLLLASASLGLATFWVTLIGMYTSSAIFGMATSVLSASAHLAARDNSSDDEYVLVVAWFHLVFGFASILTGSVSGIIYDVTGSFQISFAVLAAVPLVSIVPMALDDLRRRMPESNTAKL